MKKVHLFAIAFLVGITAQASINTAHSSATPQGNYDRYLNSQSVTFVEDGVTYEVFLNGSFDFDMPHYTRSYRGRKVKVRRNAQRRGVVITNNSRRIVNKRIFKDRRGVIHAIGQTKLRYNDYGRLNKVGGIRLRYSQGKLLQVGDMHIIYNRRGLVTRTVGNINHRNIIYGVCGVSPILRYENYNQRGRSVVQSNYTVAYDDDWNDDNDDDDSYTQTGRRTRH
ncbi:MAG: hypothetical protein ABJM06_07545 [Gilvibacter sp.]